MSMLIVPFIPMLASLAFIGVVSAVRGWKKRR